MDATTKRRRRGASPSTMKEVIPMPDANQIDVDVRPDPPEGMTYSRKGELVKRRKQTARTNKVFVVMQIIDADGNAVDNMSKRNVKVLKTERNSDKVLELIDSGEYDGAFYLRLDLAAK